MTFKARFSRADDLDLLDILDRNERQGQSAAVIAKALGKSRSSVLGLMHRFKTTGVQTITDRATKAENRDGGMPPRWWERRT
jgi:hypothetical protein